MIALTQDEVDELPEGTLVVIRWADRTIPLVKRKVVYQRGLVGVNEVKPSGFPTWVRLSPVATTKRPMRMKVYLAEDFE